MGRPISQYKVDISHQEVERILEELEQMCHHTPDCWIAVEAGALWICHDQGYEDMAEFEDALHGTFEEFLSAMPHVETKQDEKGRAVFRLKQEPPQSEWQGRTLKLQITQGSDLWNTLFKSQYATVELPDLEFEVSADGKRKIDSLYNHIASAVFNLGMHVSTTGSGMLDDHKEKIMDCVGELNALLDVSHPWTWIVHDPSGLSMFSDMSAVEVLPLPEGRRGTIRVEEAPPQGAAAGAGTTMENQLD